MKQYLMSIIGAIDALCNIVTLICFWFLATDRKGFIVQYNFVVKLIFWIVFFVAIMGVIFIPGKDALNVMLQ